MRALLRRQLWRSTFKPSSLRRAQHDYPPHKEYFQNPTQTPLPSAKPFPTPLPPPPVFPTERSYLNRAFRSVGWSFLFLCLGVAAGTSVITWEYLEPAFDPDSEEEHALQEEILEMLDMHPLVQSLRESESGWVEEKFYVPVTGDIPLGKSDLVTTTLTGSQGLTCFEFTSPSSGIQFIVFFAGNGLEGWPDTVHGGLISTMFVEAMTRHVLRFYSTDATAWEVHGLDINFQKPMRSGEIYCMMVPPAPLEVLRNRDDPSKTVSGSGQTLSRLQFQPVIMQLHGFQVQTDFDESRGAMMATLAFDVGDDSAGLEHFVFAQAVGQVYIEKHNQGEQGAELGEQFDG